MPMQGKTVLVATWSWPNNPQFSVQRPLRDQPPPLTKILCRGCRYQHAKMLPPNPPNCYKKTMFYFKNHQLFEILDLFITFLPLSFLKNGLQRPSYTPLLCFSRGGFLVFLCKWRPTTTMCWAVLPSSCGYRTSEKEWSAKSITFFGYNDTCPFHP